MKPIAIHLDRLSQALAAKGVDLKRTDLLQVAAAAFGYHNQNEASAASQRGDLTPPAALPVCRVPVPSMPHDRTVVILQDVETDMVYGIDAAFFDGPVSSDRAQRYGPTPFGGMADLTYAAEQPATAWSREHDQATASLAFLDRAVREAELLKKQLDSITGLDDEQADLLGQAENSLSRLLASLRGGAEIDPARCRDENGQIIYSPAERASHRKDVDGMAEAVDEIVARHASLALLTPETAIWAQDCIDALKAGLRIAGDWKSSYEQEVRFGPDWRAWTKDLKKASTRSATPLSDLDLHKIRHAVADNHCKSTESERSEVRWRVGQLMEKHARALLLRLDIAEAQLAGALPPVLGSTHVAKDTLWRVDVGMPGGQGNSYATAFFRLAKDEDADAVGKSIATDLADGLPIEFCRIRRAPREEVAYRLLDAGRQAIACMPDNSPARRALLGAIATADRILPPVIGNQQPQSAPPAPVAPEGTAVLEEDRQEWRRDPVRALRLQNAIVEAANGHAIDRTVAIAAISRSFGFDHLTSSRIIEGRDPGVASHDFGGENNS